MKVKNNPWMLYCYLKFYPGPPISTPFSRFYRFSQGLTELRRITVRVKKEIEGVERIQENLSFDLVLKTDVNKEE